MNVPTEDVRGQVAGVLVRRSCCNLELDMMCVAVAGVGSGGWCEKRLGLMWAL